MHTNATGKAKRIKQLRIIQLRHVGLRPASRIEGRCDSSRSMTMRTRKILPVPRHRLMTSDAPGILFSLFPAAFGF